MLGQGVRATQANPARHRKRALLRHLLVHLAPCMYVQADSAPERHDAAMVALFFVFWMFVGSFFALNLFVGKRLNA